MITFGNPEFESDSANYGQIITREANRENKTYQQHTLSALGKITATGIDKELSLQVSQIVRKVFDKLVGPDFNNRMDIDGEDERLRDRILIGGIQAMQDSFIPRCEAGTRVDGNG